MPMPAMVRGILPAYSLLRCFPLHRRKSTTVSFTLQVSDSLLACQLRTLNANHLFCSLLSTFLGNSKRDSQRSPQTAPVTSKASNPGYYFQSYLQDRDLTNTTPPPPSACGSANLATTATSTTFVNHSSAINSAPHGLSDRPPGYNHPMLSVGANSSVAPQAVPSTASSSSSSSSPANYSHFILSHNLAGNFPPAPPLPPKQQKALTKLISSRQPQPHPALLNRMTPRPPPPPPAGYKTSSGLLLERTPNIFESLVGSSSSSSNQPRNYPQTPPPPVPYSSPKPQRKVSLPCEMSEQTSAKVNPPKASSSGGLLSKSNSQSSTSSSYGHRPLERTVANSRCTTSSSTSYQHSPSLKLTSGNNVYLATSVPATSRLSPVTGNETAAMVDTEDDGRVTSLTSPSSSNTSSGCTSSSTASTASSSASLSSSSPPTPPVRKRTAAQQPCASSQVRSTLAGQLEQHDGDKLAATAASRAAATVASSATTATWPTDDFVFVAASGQSAEVGSAIEENNNQVCNRREQSTAASSSSFRIQTGANKPNPIPLGVSSDENTRVVSLHNNDSSVYTSGSSPSSFSSGANLVNAQKTPKIANGANELPLCHSKAFNNDGGNDYENLVTTEDNATAATVDGIVSAAVSDEFVLVSTSPSSNLLLQPLSGDHSPPNESSSVLSSSSSTSSFEQLSIVNGSLEPAFCTANGRSQGQSGTVARHQRLTDADFEEGNSETDCDPTATTMLKPTGVVPMNGQHKRVSKRANRDGSRRYAREISMEEVQVAASASNLVTSPTDAGQDSLLNDCQNIISRFENSLLIGNNDDVSSIPAVLMNHESAELSEPSRLGRRRSSRRRNSSHSSDDELTAINEASIDMNGAMLATGTATTPASGGSTPTTSTSSSYVNEVCPAEDIELDPNLQSNAAANYQHNLEDIVEVSDSGSEENSANNDEVPPRATPLMGRSREDLNGHQEEEEEHFGSSVEGEHGRYLSSQSRDRSALQSSSSNLSRYSEEDGDDADEELDESENEEETRATEDETEPLYESLNECSAGQQEPEMETETTDCPIEGRSLATTSPAHRPLERVGVHASSSGSQGSGQAESLALVDGTVVLRNRRHPAHQRRSATVVLGE